LVRKLAANGTQFVGGVAVQSVRRVHGQLLVSWGEQTIAADQVLSATGLEVDPRMVRMMNLDFQTGFLVDPSSMKTSDDAIFALGDCASFAGKTFRFIEPIQRQAKVIADRMCDLDSPGFEPRPPVVRLKSRSMPMTFNPAS
jgi:rubredoxin---NAD+ reductase